MNAQFRAIYLPALAQFAARQDVRYYLNGFLIEPAPDHIGGVYLVATDGNTATIIHDPQGSSDGIYIMPVPAKLTADCRLKRSRKGDTVLGEKMLSFDGSMAILGDDTGVLRAERCKPIDGKFPDWRRACAPSMPMGVCDDGSQPASVLINPGYLKRCADVTKTLTYSRSSWDGLEIWAADKMGRFIAAPSLVGDEHRIFFVIMHMRGAGDYPERLNWISTLSDRWEKPEPGQEADQVPAGIDSEGGSCD